MKTDRNLSVHFNSHHDVEKSTGKDTKLLSSTETSIKNDSMKNFVKSTANRDLGVAAVAAVVTD